MRSLSSLSVQSARCSRTAHATRASISAAGAPPQRWNDVPRGTMRLPRASKINPVRRDPVSSRDLRRAPRLAASRACKDHTDADPQRHSPVGSCRPSTCPCGAMPQICRRNSDALLAPESQSFLGNIVAGLRHSRAWKSSLSGAALHVCTQSAKTSQGDYSSLNRLDICGRSQRIGEFRF